MKLNELEEPGLVVAFNQMVCHFPIFHGVLESQLEPLVGRFHRTDVLAVLTGCIVTSLPCTNSQCFANYR